MLFPVLRTTLDACQVEAVHARSMLAEAKRALADLVSSLCTPFTYTPGSPSFAICVSLSLIFSFFVIRVALEARKAEAVQARSMLAEAERAFADLEASLDAAAHRLQDLTKQRDQLGDAAAHCGTAGQGKRA